MSYSDDFKVLTSKAPVIWLGNIKKMYKQRPGFFTPYKDPADFASTLAAPILDPLIMGLAGVAYAGASAVVLALSAIPIAGMLCSAFLCGCIIDTTAKAAAATLFAGLAALGLSIVNLAAAAVSIPYNLLNLLTRSVASLIAPLLDCCELSSGEMDELAADTANTPA